MGEEGTSHSPEDVVWKHIHVEMFGSRFLTENVHFPQQADTYMEKTQQHSLA